MIEQVHRIQNNIIIFVSHNMADVASLSDKVMVMDGGRLILSELLRRSSRRKTGWSPWASTCRR